MSASVDILVFHTTHRCHSVFSCFSPEGEFHCRLVASENVATRFPPDVERTSGSAPRFPINVTLFRLRLTIPPGDGLCWRRSPYERDGAFAPANSRASLDSIARRSSHLQPQHNRVFDGFSVVAGPPRDRLESTCSVQGARRSV